MPFEVLQSPPATNISESRPFPYNIVTSRGTVPTLFSLVTPIEPKSAPTPSLNTQLADIRDANSTIMSKFLITVMGFYPIVDEIRRLHQFRIVHPPTRSPRHTNIARRSPRVPKGAAGIVGVMAMLRQPHLRFIVEVTLDM
jgi:hypothetical protein